MSPIYGDITLINGRILNLKTELGSSLPTFVTTDVGRLFFDNSDNTLKINDGSSWVTLQFSNTNTSSPLLVTLGQNWINMDLSFNPTPFNALDNIDGLTSNDSLFSVIAALDSAITDIGSQRLIDLDDTSFGSLAPGDIIFWTGTIFSNASLNTLADSYLDISTTSLNDIESIAPYSSGDSLVYSEAAGALVNRKSSFTYTNTASDTAFLIEHNLGTKYPLVQIINYQTGMSIISNYSISYDDVNTLTLTLNTAAPVVVVIQGLKID